MVLAMSPPSPAASSASDGSSNSVSTGPPRTPVFSDLPLATPIQSTPKGSDAQTQQRQHHILHRLLIYRREAHNQTEQARQHGRTPCHPQRRRAPAEGDPEWTSPRSSPTSRRSGVLLNPRLSNSSIAHINASRRHRVLAAQQLRLLKNECDALRHEVNEWRMRASVPGVEEPRRPDGFGVILNGELEFEAGDMMEGDEGDEEDDYAGGGVYSGRQYVGGRSYPDEAEDRSSRMSRRRP
ncbi:hypothetical protein B0H10DRAFT_412623 [Mycena sp. CBHHK59/15]|nr:hypothetical protein B0H10DRAFT_412623 [Mycena sp. CBHHK59/15]